ncbi:MAG TPA: ATPase, T2SS/T4P/T4SS family [Patescibacteria group bacterium]|nr:ATPase, T2SS/T4P/T4SS family [Patescibacteria group bacterium]
MIIKDDQLKAIMLRANLVDETKFNEVQEYAKNTHISLADAFVERDLISDENLGVLISDELKIPFIVLSKVAISPEVVHILPERIARKHKVILFAKDEQSVKLAMVDPTDQIIQDMIARKTGLMVVPYMATERDMYSALRIYRTNLQKSLDELIEDEVRRTGIRGNIDAPIAKIVDLIINYAYEDRASDIHIEAEELDSLVRFRIDGILHDVLFLPKNLHDQVITRIKVLSRLRTDEHMAPQDGKMRIKLEEEDLDIRVSILPLVDGEKAVLRLLASRFRKFSLLDLGMSEEDLKKITNAFSKSFGMILSTGPTGSGKTTSIYSILKILNVREKNITTIEDPVEYRIKGVNQIHVNTKAGLTFANGLRSILRQDPNIVFVGEIRDDETAGIAVNAALTGHLVLSTLHTNDAATTLPRLTDMGVEPFLVASTVNVIFAQRLIRKICDMCKVSTKANREDLKKHISNPSITKAFGNDNEFRVYKGAGCKVCHMTGYQGRIGVFEVLEVTKNVRDAIYHNNDANTIASLAVSEGMNTMLDDGLKKVAKGITTIEEVLRVTKIDS